MDLTYAERMTYQAICAAADAGLPCPLNLDIEDLTGFSSASMGSSLVRRLEQKGLIRVERYQRFRRVQVCATGKWTARPEGQRSRRKHVPRGAGSASGRLAKQSRRIT
ncbi:MAG: hypothetical protein CL804_03525 [Citromicrobium sp.]|nr:hypothetical protein [Citromicrobium sp.]|tara:strand:- start:10145 stop:10468 length:324 start_codon:yes stop_codon:yes gene_type:complete